MATANERTEREFQSDVNQAVANTEDEIFQDALGDEPLENDGDTSLEEMGEGLEGEHLDEEDDADEEGEEAEGDEAEEDGAEEAEEAEGDEQAEEPQRDQRQRPERQDRRDIPLRQERDRRRAAEGEAAELRRQLAEMNGRLTEISARVNAPAPKPAATEQRREKPDMFADPEGYERWVKEEAERIADAKVQERFTAFQQQQQQERETVLNDALNATATGPRGFEFQAAYRALTSLPKDAQSTALVGRIVRSPDPGQAILDWFEDNGAEEFREQIAQQLGLAPTARDTRRPNGNSRQMSRQPRHETRLPPSLNSARGGGRQAIQDPEMLDDRDESVFAFATRR
jgi:hypothetical protein